MLGRRFLLDTLIALGLMLVFLGVGAMVATPLGVAVCSFAQVKMLVFTGIHDIGFLSIAPVFGLPPVVAWIAALFARVQLGAPPSATSLGIYLGVAMTSVAAGIAAQAWTIADLMQGVRNDPHGIAPTITIESLGLARSAWQWGIGGGTVLCVVVAIRAGRARQRARSAAG